VGFAVGVRSGCSPHAYRWSQVAWHDCYVGERDHQERATVQFFTLHLQYPPIVGFLSRRLPASHFVHSLTWSISDVEHISKCDGRNPLRPTPDMQTTKCRVVSRQIFCVVLADSCVGFSHSLNDCQY